MGLIVVFVLANVYFLASLSAPLVPSLPSLSLPRLRTAPAPLQLTLLSSKSAVVLSVNNVTVLDRQGDGDRGMHVAVLSPEVRLWFAPSLPPAVTY